MPAVASITFRKLSVDDLRMLHHWLARPHVAEWWQPVPTWQEVVADFMPMTDATATTRGYIALLNDAPLGFIQSYVVMGSGEGWWEDETDPGARGIDQFLADGSQLGCGLGNAMIRAFVDMLFLDAAVTKVQADPSPDNTRAIRCYLRAGFATFGEVVTPDGFAMLMICERSDSAL